MAFTVKIKWGKEIYQQVEVNTAESPILFKAQIFALTGVQPERQKVMCKGQTLKDDEWGKVELSNGAMVLVMGSKEEDVPVEPVEKPIFVEDMTESELASAMDLPGGLVNLGNTCYMNATVQCLKTVPELCDSLKKYEGTQSAGVGGALVSSLRDTIQIMEKSTQIPPLALLASLHSAIPRFKEREPAGHGAGASAMGGGGGLAQQDANECWTEVVRILQQKLPNLDNSTKSVIDLYFGGKLDVEMKCVETEDEPISKNDENFLQLSCFISQEVKYLQSGLRSKMQEQITKMSSVLGRDAVFTKTSKISRLPAYLTVQFVRFYYKEKEAINAKILKDVKFPIDLDVYELCSNELQEKLDPMRAKFKVKDDAKAQATLLIKEDPGSGSKKGPQPPAAKQQQDKKYHPFSFANDVGSNNSGLYNLQAVLTHRGRSSSSGHYVAWVRWNSPQNADDCWLKCDDEDVTPVTSEDVLKLSGGGDWHCAYVLLYGPRLFEEEDEVSTVSDMETG